MSKAGLEVDECVFTLSLFFPGAFVSPNPSLCLLPWWSSFIHSVNKYLLSTYNALYFLGPVLGIQGGVGQGKERLRGAGKEIYLKEGT